MTRDNLQELKTVVINLETDIDRPDSFLQCILMCYNSCWT